MSLFIHRKTEYDEYSGLRKWQYRLLVTKKKIEGFDQPHSQDCVLLVCDGREPWERG